MPRGFDASTGGPAEVISTLYGPQGNGLTSLNYGYSRTGERTAGMAIDGGDPLDNGGEF